MGSPREDLGSWLEGTPGDPGPAQTRLGLPRRGSGSLASVGRRLAAVGIDWALSLAISAAFFPGADGQMLPLLSGDPLATLAVFAASTVLLVATLGHTVGQRLVGLRVVRLRDVADGQDPACVRAPGLLAALVRTVLLCLVIPAAVRDSSGRGMHDVAAATVIVRR